MARTKNYEMKNVPVESVHFLIVDDHALIRGIVSQHLKSCKITNFSFAEDGNEAIRLLKSLPSLNKDFSLAERTSARSKVVDDVSPGIAHFGAAHAYCVITDFGMPNSNGLHVMKAIRCGETNVPRDTPVILLTGYAEDYVISAALQLDVSAFILKPVSRNALWEKVERVLKVSAPVKDASVYAAVIIPDEHGKLPGLMVKPTNPQIVDEEHDKDTHSIPLSAVQPGAILAADLYGESGALLLREGSVFSKGVLHKLLDVERMSGFNRDIKIKITPVVSKPSAPGSALSSKKTGSANTNL